MGLGLGIGFAVGAGGKESDAKSLEGEIAGAGGACSPSPRPGFEGSCAEYDDLKSSHDAFRAGSVVGFAAAGLSGAALLTYLVWPRGRQGSTTTGTSARPTAFVRPREAGFTVLGSF